MNFLDINETIPTTGPFPSDEELQRVISRVHELGGIVIVNHIPWSNTTGIEQKDKIQLETYRLLESGYQLPRLPNHPSISQLISWGVDGFEVINQETFDLASYQATAQNNLIQMVGMDLHHPSVGAQVWLSVNASLDKASIMQEIRNRKTSFLFDPAGTRPIAYVDSPAAYNRLLPLTLLGDYFGMFYTDYKGMYSFQGTFCHPEMMQVNGSIIGWFIFWMIILMIAFELVRFASIWSVSRLSDYLNKRRAGRDLNL